MMLNFEVYYEVGLPGDCDYCGTSKLYAIDITRYRFLIVNMYGEFIWVDTKDCTIVEEKNDDC